MLFQCLNQSAYAYTGGKPFDAGKPCVVFIHGAQNDHSVWILQSRYLAHHGYSVLALDLPGHGRSAGPVLDTIAAMANWVLEVLKGQGVAKAVLVGHSMGSLIALQAAAQAPQQVSGLAMLGTAYPMKVSEALLKACAEDESAAFDLINRFSHSSLSHWPGSPAPGFSVFWQGRRLMERQKPGVLLKDFVACNAWQDGETSARRVQCPTLLLLGGSDAMTPPRAASGLQEIFAANLGRQLQRHVIADCGHALMAEKPDETLAALRGFLAGITAPAT